MLDVTPVSSVEYYREQNTDSRRETLQYHTDNETIERGHGLMGVWKIYGDASLTYSKAIVEGEAVKFEDLEALTRDENPDNGESYGIKRTAKSKTSARDLTLSAPKPWSILNGFSNAMVSLGGQDAELWATVAAITDEGHNLGIDAALNHAMSEEAFGVRFGQGGKDRAGATFVAAAKFDHFTSRDGDMQKHSHLVSPNLARAPDGSIRAWDNHKMSVLRGKLSALYRAEMVAYANEQFEKNGINIRFKKEGRNYTIVGLDPKIVDHFSKRRTAVLNEMYKNGYTDTKNNRRAAQVASYNSRRSKKNLPPMPELFERWIFELKQLGYTPGSMLQAMNDAAIELDQKKEKVWDELKAKAVAEGVEIPAIRPDLDPLQVAKNAVKDITTMEAVFERAKFETTMIEHMQTVCNAETALATVERIKGEGSYVQVGVKGRSKEGVFTDSNTLMEEFELMQLETELRLGGSSILTKFIERAIREGVEKTDRSGERFQLNREQADLVRHLLTGGQRRDGIGDAGTGKTTTMIVVRRALEMADYKLHLIAPTNKAVTGLAKELGIPSDRGYSVTRFIMDVEKGKITLGPKDNVILDEAGMVSRSDWVRLDRICQHTGCRMTAVGDPKQLPPVQAGAPFRMVTEAFGAGRLMEIARQKEAWARQASKDLANGNVKDGIMAYKDRGHLHILDSAEAVHEKTLETVMSFERAAPGETLLISPTNAERRMLSRRLIEEKIEAGILTGTQYFFDHADRGTDQIQNSLIMVGSVVALAESVTYKEERYPNNAIGRVTRIVDDGEGSEPYVTVKWDDGREVTFKPSHFVGYREEGDPLANVPKLAPADCLTEYQSQGLSIRNVVRPFTSSTSTQSMYVSGTRHKETFIGIIDGSRIENDIANKEGKVFTMGKDGSSRQEDDVSEAVVSRDMILARFIEECERTNSKANACDFLGGALKFHENYREHYDAKFEKTNDLYNPENRAEQKVENKSEGKAEGVENARGNGSRPPLPRASAQQDVMIKAAKELEEIAQRRTSAVAEPEIAKSPKVQAAKARIAERVSKRLPDEERQRMFDFPLTEYFEKVHKFKRVWDWQGREFLRNDTVGEISVYGSSWALRDGSIKGKVIWDYEQWRFGGTTGDAMRKVKENLASIGHNIESRVYQAPVSAPKIAIDDTPKTMRERIQLGSIEKYVADTYEKVRGWTETMIDRTMRYNRGVNAYLRDVRGWDADMQRMFPGQIGTESSKGHSNPNGAAFRHIDLDGNVWNVERKGIKKEGDKRSFSQMWSGTKRLGLMKAVGADHKGPVDYKKFDVLYAGESLIDAGSAFKVDGKPKGAVLASTFGNASHEGLHDLYMLAKLNPDSTINICLDNDSAGQTLGALAREAATLGFEDAAKELGRPVKGQIIDRFPEQQYKDWNDQIRERVVTVEERAADQKWIADLEADRAKGAEQRARGKEERQPVSQQPAASQKQRRPPLPPLSRPASRWARPIMDPEAEARRKQKELEDSQRQQRTPKGPSM